MSAFWNPIAACGLIVAVLGLAMPADVYACGESKFRAGHGLKYQSYKAEVPGTVLVYSSAEGRLAPRALRKAGHRVVTVESESEFHAALAGDTFDVVIVPYARADIADGVQAVQRNAVVVPVVRGRNDIAAAESKYGSAISSVSGTREIIGLVNALVQAAV